MVLFLNKVNLQNTGICYSRQAQNDEKYSKQDVVLRSVFLFISYFILVIN
jgi:hypothetical protein